MNRGKFLHNHLNVQIKHDVYNVKLWYSLRIYMFMFLYMYIDIICNTMDNTDLTASIIAYLNFRKHALSKAFLCLYPTTCTCIPSLAKCLKGRSCVGALFTRALQSLSQNCVIYFASIHVCTCTCTSMIYVRICKKKHNSVLIA